MRHRMRVVCPQEGVESRAVIHFHGMAEFMDEDVCGKRFREKEQEVIEGDGAGGRSGSPARTGGADADERGACETVFVRQLQKARGEEFPGKVGQQRCECGLQLSRGGSLFGG